MAARSGAAVVLAACGAGGAEQAATKPAAALAPARLDMWHHWGGARLQLVDEMARRFTALHPGVTIEHSVIQGDRVEKITAAAAGDGLPSVLMINRRELPQYTPMGFLLPLTDLAKRSKVGDDQFITTEIKSSYAQGKLMTLPMVTGGDLQFVYYNRQLWKRAGLDPDKNPPKTWAELRIQVRPLTLHQGGDITQLGFPVARELTAVNRYAGNWLALGGGRQVSPDGKKSELGSLEAVNTLQALVDILKDQGGADASNTFETHDKLESGSKFPTGQQASAIFGVPHWFIFKSANPDLDLGIFGLPPDAGKPQKFGAGDGWSYSIPKSTKPLNQAWAWEQFIVSDPEGAGYFLIEQARPSPVKKLNEDPEFKKKHPQWNTVVDVVSKGEQWTWPAAQARIEKETGAALADVRDGKLSPQEGARQMQQIAQRILNAGA